MQKSYGLCLCLLLLFSYCSEDAKNGGGNESVIGNWRLVAESINGVDLELSECDNEITFQFLNNSSYVFSGQMIPNPPETPPCELEPTPGLYQINEMELIFFLEEDTEFSNPISTFTIVTLSESTLRFSFNRRRTITDPDDSVSITTWERID